LDFGPICKRRSVWNCQPVGTRKVQPQIYEEHHTHRVHRWRHRPRRRASTNSVSNSPSTETFTAAGFKAKKPQNPKQQKLYAGLSASSRHTGMIKGRVGTSVEGKT
jgi:hypothetical protein